MRASAHLRNTVVLLYHGVPSVTDDHSIDAAKFESQIVFMKDHFDYITPEQLADAGDGSDRMRVLLTFDDGFKNQFVLARRVLMKHQVPAVFFIPSRHARPGFYLWFTYLRMLEDHFHGDGFTFRGNYWSMRAEDRKATVSRLTATLVDLQPHPLAMYRAIEEELPQMSSLMDPNVLADQYDGMSGEEIATLSREPLFSVGCHTVDHPYLTRCSLEEITRQIADNVAWLENVTNRKCNTIAYPIGDYDTRVIEVCRDLRLTCGFAVIPRRQSIPHFEIPRFGIYSESLWQLRCKMRFGNILRGLGMGVA